MLEAQQLRSGNMLFEEKHLVLLRADSGPTEVRRQMQSLIWVETPA